MKQSDISSGLLPEGLRDGLPPLAAHREAVVQQLLALFAANGYDLVAPPLLEYEAGLHGRLDNGQGDSSDSFRLLDPTSQNMLVLRADITRQVARIASTRMTDMPRPLRLCYTGSALRTRGSQMRPARQVRQVGFELIGSNGVLAARELAELLHQCFSAFGLPSLTYDLAAPGLVPRLCEELDLDEAETALVRTALDNKDSAALADLPVSTRNIFQGLIDAIGPTHKALNDVSVLELPSKTQSLWNAIAERAATIGDVVGPDRLHLDPGEVHGFSYQEGWALSVFADGIRGELGRGGAYELNTAYGPEPAMGFTFYPDVFADEVPRRKDALRVLVASGAEVLPLQAKGYVTVRALEGADLDAEAQAHGCEKIFENKVLRDVS